MSDSRGFALYIVMAFMAIAALAALWLLQTSLTEHRANLLNQVNSQLDLALAAAEAIAQDEMLHGTWTGNKAILHRGVDITLTEKGRNEKAVTIHLVAVLRLENKMYRHAEQIVVAVNDGKLLNRYPVAAP
jgi:Tfp pilus assembly protein PilX